MARKSAGDYYPTQQTVFGAMAMANFTMPLERATALIGLTCTRFTTAKICLLEIDPATGVTKAGNTHTLIENNSADDFAYCCINGFSASQNGVATADVSCWFTAATPGATSPLKVTDSSAALALADQPTLHTLGPITVNGSAIPGVISVSGALNHDASLRQTDGDLYPSLFSWKGSDPVLTIEHSDPLAVLSALGLQGEDIADTTKVTFRQRGATGLIDAAVLSVTVADGFCVPQDISGGVGQTASQGIVITPAAASATAHPWTVGA